VAKTHQNSIFLDREAYILDSLYIVVSHMSFYEIAKFSNICSKYKGVSLRFYQKSLVCSKKLWITDPQYGGYDQEILSFGQILPQTGDFRYNRRRPYVFWAKIWVFFKTFKNSYTRLLCIINPQYEDNDQEILSFDQFLPQIAHFR
jgi:hypothetical protein